MGKIADSKLGQQRIEELEARVKWLEGALTSVLQERRQSAPPAKKSADPFAFIEDDLAPVAGQLVKTMPMSEMLAAESRAAAAKNKGADLAGADLLRFSSTFATLDDRLREQQEQEAAPARATSLAPPVTIDPDLIDQAFARPAPELIEVRAAIEDSYPHLLERITATWGQPEALRFLRRLIVDDRGSRQGFPFEVMSELLTLSALAEAPLERSSWAVAGA